MKVSTLAMKNLVFAIVIVFTCSRPAFCAPITVDILVTDENGAQSRISITPDDKTSVDLPATFTEYKTITVQSDIPANHILRFTIAGESKDYTTSKAQIPLTFSKSLLDQQIVIELLDNAGNSVIPVDKRSFRFRPETPQPVVKPRAPLVKTPPPVTDILNRYAGLKKTPFGLINPGANKGERRMVHIFFDQYGNNLLSTTPQGISNAQYVVHVIYPVSSRNPGKVSYSVKQTSGSFNSGLIFNNANIRDNIGNLQEGEELDALEERTFLLGTATDDLSFDIVTATGQGIDIQKRVVESHTIKMSPTYHGSFDVGFMRTKLANPTYSLVESPNSADTMVLKVSDNGARGIVTVMATFYVSPVVLLESLRGDVPFYKITGRNFLDDHKIYERIYPSIGVGLSSKVFDNAFFGLNWEIARGLSVFWGRNFGKVNTFTLKGVEEGVTPLTQGQFDYYSRTEWKTSSAFGVNVDLLVVTNLLRGSGS